VNLDCGYIRAMPYATSNKPGGGREITPPGDINMPSELHGKGYRNLPWEQQGTGDYSRPLR
jgi:hypothetical protein